MSFRRGSRLGRTNSSRIPPVMQISSRGRGRGQLAVSETQDVASFFLSDDDEETVDEIIVPENVPTIPDMNEQQQQLQQQIDNPNFYPIYNEDGTGFHTFTYTPDYYCGITYRGSSRRRSRRALFPVVRRIRTLRGYPRRRYNYYLPPTPTTMTISLVRPFRSILSNIRRRSSAIQRNTTSSVASANTNDTDTNAIPTIVPDGLEIALSDPVPVPVALIPAIAPTVAKEVTNNNKDDNPSSNVKRSYDSNDSSDDSPLMKRTRVSAPTATANEEQTVSQNVAMDDDAAQVLNLPKHTKEDEEKEKEEK